MSYRCRESWRPYFQCRIPHSKTSTRRASSVNEALSQSQPDLSPKKATCIVKRGSCLKQKQSCAVNSIANEMDTGSGASLSLGDTFVHSTGKSLLAFQEYLAVPRETVLYKVWARFGVIWGCLGYIRPSKRGWSQLYLIYFSYHEIFAFQFSLIYN